MHRVHLVSAILFCMILEVASELDACDIRSVVNGCSVPRDLPTPFKKSFTTCCNRHDICYLCGYTFGITRHECDLQFLLDMGIECEKMPRIKRKLCLFSMRWYHKAVEMFGKRYFHSYQYGICSYPFLQQCLPSFELPPLYPIK